MTTLATLEFRESWQATTSSPRAGAAPFTFSAQLGERIVRHVVVDQPANHGGRMAGELVGTNIAFMSSMLTVEACPPRTTAIGDLMADFERDGMGPAIRAARARLATRVKPNSVGHPTLRGLRLKHELSQAELATRLNTSQPHIARLESGRSEPGRETMRKLAEVFGIDMNAIDAAFEQGVDK
ncbi:MAG TPA: hypothetical protein DEO93_03835 [Stenotrophomonas sp.]|nr:hypothetical protein [Stenotrophomonas sp.]